MADAVTMGSVPALRQRSAQLFDEYGAVAGVCLIAADILTGGTVTGTVVQGWAAGVLFDAAGQGAEMLDGTRTSPDADRLVERRGGRRLHQLGPFSANFAAARASRRRRRFSASSSSRAMSAAARASHC